MRFKVFLLLIGLIASLNASAQKQATEIGLQTDNDSYLLQGSDRYYTNGLFIYYRHALKVANNSTLQNKVLGFETGQKIFNPRSASIYYQGAERPERIDRPFAAYLYVGSTLNFLYKNESNLKIGAQLGIVGPGALGKPTQNFIHNTLGFYHPRGWQYQIDNNLELNLSAEYNKLLARSSWIDLSLSSYLNLGNGFSGLGAGPLVRLGNFNQLFNSVITQSTAIQANGSNPLHAHELFFYYRPQLNYVAYDATIQGGLFTKHDPNSLEITSDPEKIIFSNQFGLAYSAKRFTIDAAVILHTVDTKQMVQSHQWATLTFFYRFH